MLFGKSDHQEENLERVTMHLGKKIHDGQHPFLLWVILVKPETLHLNKAIFHLLSTNIALK